MIQAVYKGVQVEGNWFTMGDTLWLELTPTSSKKVGTEAILEKELDSLGELKSANNVINVSMSKDSFQEKHQKSVSQKF